MEMFQFLLKFTNFFTFNKTDGISGISHDCNSSICDGIQEMTVDIEDDSNTGIIDDSNFGLCVHHKYSSLLPISRYSIDETTKTQRKSISSNTLKENILRLEVKLKFKLRQCQLRRLSKDIIIEIFSFLNIQENLNASLVSTLFYTALLNDHIWNLYYQQFFTGSTINERNDNYDDINVKQGFIKRIKDPIIGDIVQICWSGQFILAQSGPYRGKAWWDGEVLEKDLERKLYRVRYIGWQYLWDEWVPRDRFRWKKNNLKCEEIGKIIPGDSVELEINGRLCTTYLECIVYGTIKCNDDESSQLYVIKNAINSQDVVVARENLRFVKRNTLVISHL